MGAKRLSIPILLLAACADHNGTPPGLTIGTTPRFEVRTELLTGTASHVDYVVSDLDSDGDLDMAVVGTTGELQIMLGNGPTFTGGQQLAVGGQPVWIARGDFDRDGDDDLVIVRRAGGAAGVFWNQGDATFAAGPSLPIGPAALSVVVGDANDDGMLDVVVGRPLSPDLVVHLGDGNGNFAAGSSIALPGGGSPFTLALGDVTRDGRADLLVSDPDLDRVLVFPGDSSAPDFLPTPIVHPVAGGPVSAVAGDLSGDGWNDLLVAAHDDNQLVMIQDPQGGGVQRVVLDLTGAPSLCAIGDVTGDGLNDLVTCMATQASAVVWPQAPSGMGQPFQLDTSGTPLRPVIADIDRNGRNDLVALAGLGSRINLWLAGSDGRLNGARSYACGLPSSMVLDAGDFDRDGRADVVVGSLYNPILSFLESDATGALTAAVQFDVQMPVRNVRQADVDGDGRQDVVVGVQDGFKVLHNVGTPGLFAFELLPPGAPVFGAGTGPLGMAVVDFDGDGLLDVIQADFHGDQLVLTHGAGTAPIQFAAPVVVPLAGAPGDVVVADFTGDDVLDIAVTRVLANDIAILRSQGGTLVAHANLPVQNAPTYLLGADFDRNGRVDLVTTDAAADVVEVLFQDGANDFVPVSFPAGENPTALLCADLTGDNRLDVLMTSQTDGMFRVLVGDGLGNFPNVFAFPGTFGATGAVLRDLTGDGHPELLIGSQMSRRVSVVRNLAGN